MRVQFVRSDHGAGYAVLILREDGVAVRLPEENRRLLALLERAAIPEAAPDRILELRAA